MAKREKRHIPRPQIPSGKYVLEYLTHWHYRIKEGLKLVILFRVAKGEHQGIEIVRQYNVKPASGNRGWKAIRSGSLWAEFCAVMHGHLDTTKLRLDELPISRMKGLLIRAKVRAVKRNRDHVPLVGGAAYSVVKNLLGSEMEDKGSIPLHAKPSPALAPTLTPAPIPSGSVGEVYAARASEKAMGKNGGVNGEDDGWTDELREFVRDIERAERENGDPFAK